MYKRIIVAVAGALFALLALLAAIITDLYDRDFPQAIGAESRFSLDLANRVFLLLKRLRSWRSLMHAGILGWSRLRQILQATVMARSS